MVSVRPPFDPASLPPGTLLAEKYELGVPIGWGEHSVVYRAVHRQLLRPAAVKILARTDQLSENRFAREAKLAGTLRHPNIVDIYETGRLEDGRAFLVMEYLEGETLEDRLHRTGLFSITDAMRYGQELLRGLQAVHAQKIIHRDLRPANLFIAEVRGAEVLKILDFGISRRLDETGDTGLTRPGTILGDAAYLAPEQLTEDGIVDHRTDLYTTGVLLYQLLTGRLPFEHKSSMLLVQIVDAEPEPPSRRRLELTADVDTVILRAMAKAKEDRFEDAVAMAGALRLTALFADYLDPSRP